MDNQSLIKVISDHFQESPDVYETCMYAMSALNINDAVMIGMMSKSTEVKGIPPESYALMKRFDNGLTNNKFWLENFAPIKMIMALADIKLETQSHYINFAENNNNGERERKLALKAVRGILMARCDVLTVIAFLWKGIHFAEDFDAKFRMAFQLTPEHEKYFSDRGI